MTTALVLAVVVAVTVAVSGLRIAYFTPALGFAEVLGVPVYVVLTTTDWCGAYWRERVVLSVAAGVMLVLAVGVAANFLLPHVGVARPLDRIPVVVSCGIAWSALWLRRRRGWRPLLPVLRTVPVGRTDVIVVAVGALSVIAAVLGANRLNNGAGSAAAVSAQGLVVVALAATMHWRHRLAAGTTAIVVYAVGLALLLQTSLRGWFVTGHDIQHEYFVFRRTAAAGAWTFNTVHDPYNACLSITILPTMILRFTGLDGPYVYKVAFQLVFAFSGVISYAIAARLLTRGLALVSAVFFMAFPTYFTDMPFLNRQEIAFLLTGCCVLLFVVDDLPVRRRRTWMILLVSATVVTHYSTSYLLLAVLAFAKVTELAVRRRREGPAARIPRAPVSVTMLVVSGVICAAWGSGSAQSDRHLAETLGTVVSALDSSTSSRAGGAAYSLVGVKNPSQEQLLRSYVRSTLPPGGAGRVAAARVSAAYPPQLAPSEELPVTALGRRLDALGIDVGAANGLVRSLSARLLQVLVVAGLVACVVSRRWRPKIPSDLLFVAVGSVVSVGAQVVLPVISEDYGLLRAFQQALFVLAPFVTIGSVWIAGLVGRRLAVRATGLLSLALLGSLAGLIPEVSGGYPAQLTLNNSGQYYDLYYVSVQEVAAATWLSSRAPAGASVAAGSITAEALANYASARYAGDIYPTLLLAPGPFVFLGRTEVRLGRATVTETGNFITYRYPLAYLDATRNLVYASSDDRIYK